MAFQSTTLIHNDGNHLHYRKSRRNQNSYKKTPYALFHPQFGTQHQLVNVPQNDASFHFLQNEGMTTMTMASTDSAVMSTQDIVYGTILAFALAYLWYFLNNDDDESDLEPSFWENESNSKSDKKSNQLEMNYELAESVEDTGISNDKSKEEENEREAVPNGSKDTSTSVLNWKEISRPENYILYSTKVKQRLENSNTASSSSSSQSIPADSSSTKVVTEKKLVLISLLVLFVPIFSIEFFFALSRQFLCGDPTLSLPLSSSSWAQQLCSAHLEV